MGRCKPRANENDPGLITLPEGIDELSDAVEQEFDVTTKQVCRALQCTRPFVLAHCRHIRHIFVSGDWSDKVGLGPGGGFIWSRNELRDMAVSGTVERRTRVVGAADILAGNREALDWLDAAKAEAGKIAMDPSRSPRMKSISARCPARSSRGSTCRTNGSRPITRRGARGQNCIGSTSASTRGHSTSWGPFGGRPRTAKATGTRTRNGRGRIGATERCGSPSPCPTARPRSCMRPTRRLGRGSTTSWRQFCLSSCCRRTTSEMSFSGVTIWSRRNSSCTANSPHRDGPSPQNQTESRISI